jgi:hypothetical protein
MLVEAAGEHRSRGESFSKALRINNRYPAKVLCLKAGEGLRGKGEIINPL